MRHTLLLLCCAASAAVGVAAGTRISADTRPPRQVPLQFDVGSFQLAVERAFESVGFGAQARGPRTAPRAPEERPAAAGPPSAEAGASEMRTEEGAPGDGARELPPKNGREVEAVRPFSEDERLRRTWLFRSERDVIAWLGTPDEVFYEDGGERWNYSKPDGTHLVAFFARGRLLNIMN